MSVTQKTGVARLASPFGWEQHCCLPLQPECDIDPLRRYLQVGVGYLSVNVGFAPHGIEATMRVLSSWRRQVLRNSESFALAATVDDILAAQQDGRIAVGFDLEDTNPLGGEIAMVRAYYDLGVRSMLLTYNSENQAGFGCHAPDDTGLTSFGRAVVEEMNRVGMMVDVSHCGYRTSMDALERSASPVIFSHSSMRAVWDHERNIRDDQARACAATGGVIGINGVGIFLGEGGPSVQAMARHIDYAVQLVGPQHVGIGTDYVFDSDDLNRELAENPQIFPESYRRAGRIGFFPPEQLAPLEAELSSLGYPAADIAAIMGGNFLRVARQVWKPGPDGGRPEGKKAQPYRSPTGLQAEVDRLVAKHRVPGAVLAWWQDGVLATAAAGIANLSTGSPMTVDTGFLTGSITKVWAATLIMVLVEEGVLDVDVPIVEYAPDVQFGADVEVARSLTVRHLLNHSSGVDSGDYFVDTRGYPDGVEDYLAPLARAGQLTAPGIVSSYNNAGWIVAEVILRRLTGRNFHELLRERVIEPLGLGRTVLSAPEAILHRTAIGSFPARDGTHRPTPQFMYPDAWAGAGSTLITTVEDTIRFLRMHLSGGVSAEGRRLLRAESAAAMQTPTSPAPTGPAKGFGLGWMYHEQNGRRVLHHGGGSPGGIAHAVISPADATAAIAFVNSSVGTPLHADLLGLVLPDGTSPLATPAAEIRGDVGPEPFTGSYRRKSMRVDVLPDGGELLVRLTPVTDELRGATVELTGMVTEFPAAPISETALISRSVLPGGAQTLTFSEPGPGGFQLLYMDRRLARRLI